MSSLASYLKELIKINGPITVARFMKNALTHPSLGYYNTKEVFGRKGDFITSPEISQIFGESIGLKIVQWARMHKPKGPIHLIELGPGRGTFMHDVLRTVKQFSDVKSQVKRVSLVEVSEKLRKFQENKLGEFSCNIDWAASVDQFNPERCKKTSTVILAHEFFDALPIHAFNRISGNEWREIMVGLDQQDVFALQLAHSETFSQKLFLPKHVEASQDAIEVCPEGIKIANWIKKCFSFSPSALGMIIDYGIYGAPSGSLRAIKEHKILGDPLQDVGECDLSADVDFRALDSIFKDVFETEFKYQGQFLLDMGIRERTMMLIERNRHLPEIASHLVSSYERLVNPKEMGSIYKVLTISKP